MGSKLILPVTYTLAAAMVSTYVSRITYLVVGFLFFTQVWNDQGDLLGKFFLGTTSANLVFAGKGRLIILAETKVFLAKIAAEGVSLTGPH